MRITSQKRLASKVLKVPQSKVKFNSLYLADIKEAITKTDIRQLVSKGVIGVKAAMEASRSRARKRNEQRKKGRQKGYGSRKGTNNARSPVKQEWMIRVRLLRSFLKELRDKELITTSTYRDLYRKAKGGFFRNKRHLKLYMGEHELINKKE